MKKNTVRFVFLLILLVGILVVTLGAYSTSSTKGRPALHVLLISLDGFRPEFYLEGQYPTPYLRKLVESGAYATAAIPVFPTLTYTNHTTLTTGVYPKKHRIDSNNAFSWESGPQPAWLWEADHIKSPTLFQLAKRAGLKTAAVRWPVTLFADIDFLVPEIFSMKGYYEGDEFELTAKYTRPDLMESILKHTTLQRYNNEHEMDDWVAQAAASIVKNSRPSFIAIHLANLDHVEHGSGRDGPAVIDAVAQADRNVGTIMEAANLDDTCIIVTGDHGFRDVRHELSPNVLFAKQGWIALKDNKVVDWKVIALAGGGQAAIYVKEPNLKEQAIRLLTESAGDSLSLITREQLDQLGSYPGAAFAIEGNGDFMISQSYEGEFAKSSGSLKGNHGYLPNHSELQTGFIASGCGITKGRHFQTVRLIDVAPTIAYALKLSLPDPDGTPLPLWGQADSQRLH